jgi:arylsulfatase
VLAHAGGAADGSEPPQRGNGGHHRDRHVGTGEQLGAAGLPEPTFVNGVRQKPIEGTSLLYSFDDEAAAERHETQYFEMFGNRGIYHKGWTAVTKHTTPWELVGGAMPALEDDVGELYDTNVDWTQSSDLSAEMPDKLHELQRLWLIEAVKFNVLPIDDRSGERFNADIAGRPEPVTGSSQTVFPLRFAAEGFFTSRRR